MNLILAATDEHANGGFSVGGALFALVIIWLLFGGGAKKK